jgi:electron transfer flavoprotein beta subunit
MQLIGERLGIHHQFLGVDKVTVQSDGSLKILERIEGGQYQVSVCSALPAVFAWATGELPEPPNNPQVGMMNMRTVMPALQKAQAAPLKGEDLILDSVEVPQQLRETKILKDMPVETIAKEIIDWLK